MRFMATIIKPNGLKIRFVGTFEQCRERVKNVEYGFFSIDQIS